MPILSIHGMILSLSRPGDAVLSSLRRLAPGRTRWRRPTRVVIFGADAMAEEVAAHLLYPQSDSPPIELVGVWAGDRRKVARFAGKLGVPSLSMRDALRALESVDAVIGACRGRAELLRQHVLFPVLDLRVEPLLVLDLGVPPNLDPVVATRDGVQAVFLGQACEQRDVLQTAR